MSEYNAAEITLQIQRIYAKDISFEAPNSPQMFQKNWQPEIKLDLDTASSQLSEDVYEVILRVTVTAKLSENTAFLCEVQQAGIFTVKGLEKTQLVHCLSAYCPNILFPYAQECISNMVTRGTFPQLNLTPVNFDAIFMKSIQKQTEKQSTETKNCTLSLDTL